MNRDKLLAAGVDYDQGVARFAGRAELYEKYLRKLFESGLMEKLRQQIQSGEREAAFRTAHDMKGTTGSLSMNAFFETLRPLVELLRSNGPESELLAWLAAAEEKYSAAERAAKE